MNTKDTIIWKIADELYDWYVINHEKKRGGSYRAMKKAFNLNVSTQKMYYKYFQKGWNPRSNIHWGYSLNLMIYEPYTYLIVFAAGLPGFLGLE